jgi:serine/threonine-protein kinase
MREPYFRSDFYALGHFMLFLLYSGYRTAEKKERPWYEELPLSEEGCLILKRMLQIEQAYETVDELIADMEAWLQAADAEEMVFKKTGNSRF